MPSGSRTFDAASRKVPVIANIRPSGERYLMEDFYYAGGLLGLLTRLTPISTCRSSTSSGQTWAQSLEGRGLQ